MALTNLTAAPAATLIANHDVSAEELSRACLERIIARNSEVGTFVHVDAELSLAEARRADREQPRSGLHVPVGIGPQHKPLGVQLIGRRYDDAGLHALAKHLMC